MHVALWPAVSGRRVVAFYHCQAVPDPLSPFLPNTQHLSLPPPNSCYRDRLAKEPPPDAATQAKLGELLGWLSKALQLLSLLLQHGGQMETFLDDGGVMSLCLHLAKYPAIHAQLPPVCVPPAHRFSTAPVPALRRLLPTRCLPTPGLGGARGPGLVAAVVGVRALLWPQRLGCRVVWLWPPCQTGAAFAARAVLQARRARRGLPGSGAPHLRPQQQQGALHCSGVWAAAAAN
jgi:hypothetical protein